MNFEIPLEDVEKVYLDEDGDYVVIQFEQRKADYPATLYIKNSATLMVKPEQNVLTVTH